LLDACASGKLRAAMPQAPPRRRIAGETGFSLIELLAPVIHYFGRAKTDIAKVQIHDLESALDLYRLDLERYPTQAEGLPALVEKPPGLDRWQGPI
jgi:general secretion pathway protein G